MAKQKVNRKKKREYKMHKWMHTKLINLRNTSEYRVRLRTEQLEKANYDYRYATDEYLRGIITDEEYHAIKMEHRRYTSRIKQWQTVWIERVAYLNEMIENEEYMMRQLEGKNG